MIRPQHPLSLLGAVTAALALSVGGSAAAAKPKHPTRAAHPLTKKQRASVRKRLQKKLRSNPGSALSKDFIQQAQASGLTLPLTLRLRRSDQDVVQNELRVTWDDSTWPWPDGYLGLQPSDPAPGGVIELNGKTSIEAEFGNDVSGYSGLGVVETLNGMKLAFDGTPAAPIGVSNFASPVCPPPGVAVEMERMDLATGEGTHGLLSLFGGSARVSLHVRVGTTSRLLNSDCSGDLTTAPDNRHEADAVNDPMVPITFVATFRISPSVTKDGKLRLGMLSAPDGSTQPTTFSRITLCVGAVGPSGCPTAQFPARLSIKQLNAEVLLGDQIS